MRTTLVWWCAEKTCSDHRLHGALDGTAAAEHVDDTGHPVLLMRRADQP